LLVDHQSALTPCDSNENAGEDVSSICKIGKEIEHGYAGYIPANFTAGARWRDPSSLFQMAHSSTWIIAIASEIGLKILKRNNNGIELAN
jgi:hypothetical protein